MKSGFVYALKIKYYSYKMTPPFKILIFLEILIRFSQTVKTIFQRCDDNKNKKKVLSKNQSEEQKKIKEKWTLGTFTNKESLRKHNEMFNLK